MFRLVVGTARRSVKASSKLPLECVQTRLSTTGALKNLDKLCIETKEDAVEIVHRLNGWERDLLKNALTSCDSESHQKEMTREQIKGLFVVNSIPFIGFGLLDNMIMIMAGEYIDQKLGAIFCISTMAAAALGNLISDIAGVGLSHYVEAIVHKVGIKHPPLSAEQIDSKRARMTTNAARAAGLTIGCILGMFPLLFFKEESDEKKKLD